MSALHFLGGNKNPLCRIVAKAKLMTTEVPEEVTCGTCRHLLQARHLRILPEDSDVMRSTETPHNPGYYHDDTGREFTSRGLQVYDRIYDTHGVEVRVQESSLATEDCVWVFTDRDEDLHLNVEQARALRDALDVFIEIKGGEAISG